VLRTVSFSDKHVADAVNSNFVPAWIDRGPGFKNLEFWTEKWIAESNYEMYPTKNICTFFLTPDRKVFYYAAGSYSPEMFLKILETVSSLRKALFDERMQVTPRGQDLASGIHRDLSEAYDSLQKDAEQPEGWRSLVQSIRPGAYRTLRHVHTASCGKTLQLGFEYLASLHREWAGRTVLPEFEEIRYQYLYGNDFTEETADSKHIHRPETPPSPKPVVQKIRALKLDVRRTRDLEELDVTGLRLFP
jgi:hypothetical protein